MGAGEKMIIDLDEEIMDVLPTGRSPATDIMEAVEQRDCFVRALQRQYSQFDPTHVEQVFDQRWERAGVLYGSCIDFARGGESFELRGAHGFAQMYRAKTLYAYTNVGKMLR
jgi:hypothetical protein